MNANGADLTSVVGTLYRQIREREVAKEEAERDRWLAKSRKENPEIEQKFEAQEASRDAEDPGWREREKAQHEAEEKRSRRDFAISWRRQCSKAGVPEKDTDLLLSDAFDSATAAVAALSGQTMSLWVLSGGPGCGKSTAAAWWLGRWIAEYRGFFDESGALFISSARLSRWEKYDDKAMDKLLKSPRLVVDDLGAEYLDDKGSFLSLLDELVNERYANKRPTLFTTNLNAEAFKKRYGERIADRIRESGKFVSVDAASMRNKAQ